VTQQKQWTEKDRISAAQSSSQSLLLVTDRLFSAIFWQNIANNKTQKTNNNQIQNINHQKIACRGVGL